MGPKHSPTGSGVCWLGTPTAIWVALISLLGVVLSAAMSALSSVLVAVVVTFGPVLINVTAAPGPSSSVARMEGPAASGPAEMHVGGKAGSTRASAARWPTVRTPAGHN